MMTTIQLSMLNGRHFAFMTLCVPVSAPLCCAARVIILPNEYSHFSVRRKL